MKYLKALFKGNIRAQAVYSAAGSVRRGREKGGTVANAGRNTGLDGNSRGILTQKDQKIRQKKPYRRYIVWSWSAVHPYNLQGRSFYDRRR